MANSLKDKTLKLVSAQKELQKWNSELEKRVQARTRDLKEAQDQLIAQEKLAALGQMASVVGHELRNPLAVMNNAVYLLKTKLMPKLSSPSAPLNRHPLRPQAGDPSKNNETMDSPPTTAGNDGNKMTAEDDKLDPKILKHLNTSESEILKSNAIIRDVLDFSRNRALNLAPHEVDELVEKAIERIPLPPDVTLRKGLGLNGTQVPLDEDEIRQVLVNLMENACQAMTSGGTLIVGTKTQEKFVEITIADTGCGIPQEHLSKIFAPFFTTKSRGTGLGLATVYGIVKQHQGWVELSSRLGVGTTFNLFLPKSPKPLDVSGEKPAPTPEKIAGRRETILLVEDEPMLRELASIILNDYQYHVLEAATGNEALKVWDENHGQVDLLLTDMVMPEGMNGRELADKLKARKPGLKIIYTSGYNAEVMGTDVGQRDIRFLQKPYPPPQLAQTVRECLDEAA